MIRRHMDARALRVLEVCLTILTLAGGAVAGVGDPLRIKLPYAKGATFSCVQGNHGAQSHSDGINDFAYDFDLPEGTPVLAAASGRVIRVKEGSTQGGPEVDMMPFANRVWIDHGGGRFSIYDHLQFESVTVREGELVNAGQVIARSGNTGYSRGPHLHFGVTDLHRRTVPSCFVDVAGDGVPVAERAYTSGNDGCGTAWFQSDSELPREAFARDGILLESTMPAVCLGWDETYVLRGRVTTPSKAAQFFFGRSGREGSIASKKISLTGDASFDFTFRLADYSAQFQTGAPFRYGLAPTQEDGSFRCKEMVEFIFLRNEVDDEGRPVAHLCMPFLQGQTRAYERIPSGSGEEHEDAVAIRMPEKSPVFASSAGRVIAIGSVSSRFTTQRPKALKTQSVTLDHGDGVETDYFGLAPDSVEVREGEIVQTGRRLGTSSKLAPAGEPQLGFAVRTDGRGLRTPRFADLAGASRFADAGYVTSSDAGATRHLFRADSQVRSDAFVENGLQSVTGVPAYTLHAALNYAIRGEMAESASQVAFLVRRRGEKKNAVSLVAVTQGRTYHVEVHLAEWEKALGVGTWDWTLTTASDKKEFTATRWQPLNLMR